MRKFLSLSAVPFLVLAAFLFTATGAVILGVSGEGTSSIAARLISSTEAPDAFPARRVRPTDGDLVYLLDRDAVK